MRPFTRKMVILIFLLAGISTAAGSQPPIKPVPDFIAHSHNDYHQAQPFWQAWRLGFGSIEADIFLVNDKLVVAHDSAELSVSFTLDSLYLHPLQQVIEKQKGNVFPDSGKSLRLLVDIKSEAVSTLTKLVEVLQRYASLINCAGLHIVISGNRPNPELFSSYPDWIWFDGELNQKYNEDALQKIAMMSGNFARYSSWKGEGTLPASSRRRLLRQITRAHQLHKPIRFWNAPDNPAAWKTLLELKVDCLNTDRLEEMIIFMDAEKS